MTKELIIREAHQEDYSIKAEYMYNGEWYKDEFDVDDYLEFLLTEDDEFLVESLSLIYIEKLCKFIKEWHELKEIDTYLKDELNKINITI